MNKFLICILGLSLMSGCGKNHFDDAHVSPINQSRGSTCTTEALDMLNDVVEFCDRDLSEENDKKLCVDKSIEFQQVYPNVICNLEGEVVVASEVIEDTLEEIRDEKEELIKSGIFDD